MSEAIGQPGQAALPRPLGIGEILSTAFRLYQRHSRTLLAIAAVVVVPLTLLQYLFGDWLRTRGEVTSYQQVSTATWAVGAAGLVAALAGILMYLVLTGRSPGRWRPRSPGRTRAWSRATASASTGWERSWW
jgi:hypothetical protein